MTLLNIVIENIFIVFIITGLLTILSVYIKDMCDNNEIKKNKELINNITDISIKANLVIASLALFITIYNLLR